MLWVYNTGIQLYGLIIYLLSKFNKKAALFISGRKNIFSDISKKIDPEYRHIWFHFASLGEFEQGRPLLEGIKTQYPDKRIVITFFSPSGYEIRKNYPLATGIFYLPLDTPSNAEELIQKLNPEMAIFTKYEYWYHYFKTLHRNKIPLFIISGIFRKEQIYFKWYGGFNRSMLNFVTHFFLQNEESKTLLQTLGIQNTTLSGDTRFDRVAKNASAPKSFEQVKNFCGDAPVFVAGSTWPPDEQLLAQLSQAYSDWKLIIAPHETDPAHISDLQKLFPDSIKYSELILTSSNQVLIIDNIGLLSSLYQYGRIAYIGGGFGTGIHNTLEAAAFGIPVIFGPRYEKFQEAKDLISLQAAISINDKRELQQAFERLNASKTAGGYAKDYIKAKTGSTRRIIEHLQQYFN